MLDNYCNALRFFKYIYIYKDNDNNMYVICVYLSSFTFYG